MHRITARLLLAATLLIATASASARLNVFVCEPEWAALTIELGGERVHVFSATHSGQDPHYVQARPSLIARLRSADLAVCTGAELETGWLPMLLRRARNPKVLSGKAGFFEATDHVTLLEAPKVLDRAEGDVHADGNPHIHLDPRRILKVAKALSARIQAIDKANREYYALRLSDFIERWHAAMTRWQASAATLKGKRVIVHHREWLYLLDWLGIQRSGSLEPKPSVPQTIAPLAELKELTADVIIVSPLNDTKPSQWLHEQTAIPVAVLPQTVGAVDGSDNLFDFFDEIVRRLVATL